MNNKRALETELQVYTDKIIILEAKIELSDEKITALNEIIKEKKIEKSDFFNQRDELIEKKRFLQSEKFDDDIYTKKDTISNEINELSERIGDIIEKSKASSEFIQTKYDESQVEYRNKVSYIDEVKSLQKDSNVKILTFKRKIAEIDNELIKLRAKMNEIQNKLNDDN